jgi:hypothetical protein
MGATYRTQQKIKEMSETVKALIDWFSGAFPQPPTSWDPPSAIARRIPDWGVDTCVLLGVGTLMWGVFVTGYVEIFEF